MYPYIELYWTKLHMTGIWIIVWIICFLYFTYFYAKRYGLNFWKFFNRVPVFLGLPYILGSYVHSFFANGLYIPGSFQEILFLLTPYGYTFHFVWVTLWFALAVILFLRSVKIQVEMYKWIDVLFYALCLSLIPVWIILLLWDTFIWRPTNSIFWVTSFLEDSRLTKLIKAYPLGLILSFIAVLNFAGVLLYYFIRRRYWIWVYGFIVLLLSMNIVFYFQNYDKYIVFQLFWYILDIKNYWTILLSIFIWFYYSKYLKGKWN